MNTSHRLSTFAPSELPVPQVHPQPPAPPNTTDILVLMTVKPGVAWSDVAKVLPAEVRATVRLYLDGKVRQWFQKSDGKGAVFILPATTVTEAQAIMESLPLAQAHLIDHEYVALSPLGALAALIGQAADKGAAP